MNIHDNRIHFGALGLAVTWDNKPIRALNFDLHREENYRALDFDCLQNRVAAEGKAPKATYPAVDSYAIPQ